MIASESRSSLATRVLLVLGLLAALSALAPPLLAATEPEGSSGQTTTGEPTTPGSEGAPGEKRAPGTKGTPGNKDTPGNKNTPASKGGTGKTPAPLSFTDDDLKAYRPPVVEEPPVEEPVLLLPLPPRPRAAGATPAGAPKPASPGPSAAPKPGTVGPATSAARSAPSAPAAAGKPATSPTQATKGTVQTSAPVTFAPSPAVLNPPKRKKPAAPPDPLAPFKQREAQEQYRAGQIQGLRDQIGALETRLVYLRHKRIAIVDPLNVMPQSQTDEDRQADVSLKPRDLLQQVETEIAATEAQLETTRTTLAEIEIRFGSEAGIR